MSHRDTAANTDNNAGDAIANVSNEWDAKEKYDDKDGEYASEIEHEGGEADTNSNANKHYTKYYDADTDNTTRYVRVDPITKDVENNLSPREDTPKTYQSPTKLSNTADASEWI